ncbi:MAG: DNA-3-methyladenine glycosylase family protein [Acidimicrobiales bacterium]
METFTIEPQGRFSLPEAALFGFGQRHEDAFDATMRLAFCVDGYHGQAGVSVTQAADGSVVGTIHGLAGPLGDRLAMVGTVRAQVARALSLDHDARGYEAVGDRDAVVARLLAAAPGLRPPLFHSPYEAALWSVISQRRPATTARRWRQCLSEAAGARFDVAGTVMWAAPTPEAIVELGTGGVAAVAGVEAPRAERVVGVARAALAGDLDAALLAGLPVERARALLRTIPGIGPFYAELILIRATGLTDLLPGEEPKLQALVGRLYGLGGHASPADVERVAEAWRPWRTWVSVLVRAAGARLEAASRDPAIAPSAA